MGVTSIEVVHKVGNEWLTWEEEYRARRELKIDHGDTLKKMRRGRETNQGIGVVRDRTRTVSYHKSQRRETHKQGE